jgi:hypothetical protein
MNRHLAITTGAILALLACDPTADLDHDTEVFRGSTDTGDGDGDGDGSYTALLCGSVEYAYVETSTYCDAGYSIVCGFGSFLFDGSESVCCEGIECAILPFEQGCIGDQVHVCDTP